MRSFYGTTTVEHVRDNLAKKREADLQKAYQMGLLAGINAQSMAQVKNEVLAFEDYGWSVE